MPTSAYSAEIYDFWANRHDAAVNGILAILDSCEGECVIGLIEELECLLQESDFMRQHAQDLRNRAKIGACPSTNSNAGVADIVSNT